MIAAIGSNGLEIVVWGIGRTSKEALADATNDSHELSGLEFVSVTPAQIDRIEAGEVSWADLNAPTIEIVYDDDAPNPRKHFEPLGEILHVSARYNLGDRRVSSEEIEEIQNDPNMICLPVYAYIHGRVSLSTGTFGCPWDSGQSGIVYVSRTDAAKAFEVSEVTPEVEERVRAALIAEVQEFSDYLEGNVWGFMVKDPHGKILESSWGFYGDEGKKEAERQAKYAAEFVARYPS